MRIRPTPSIPQNAARAADNDVPQASIALLVKVRAGFVGQGTSLKAWCAAHGVDRGTATYALKSATHSADAAKLRKRLIDAAKVAA